VGVVSIRTGPVVGLPGRVRQLAVAPVVHPLLQPPGILSGLNDEGACDVCERGAPLAEKAQPEQRLDQPDTHGLYPRVSTEEPPWPTPPRCHLVICLIGLAARGS